MRNAIRLLCLFFALLQACHSRPLDLSDVLDLKRPGPTSISSTGDVAFLIERYLTRNLEVTGSRRYVQEAELWLRRGSSPALKMGPGGGFVSFSLDGSKLATGVQKGDGFTYRVIDLSTQKHSDYGFTKRYTLSSDWSGDDFFYVEDIPQGRSDVQVFDTKRPRVRSVDRVMVVKASGQMEAIAEGVISDVTASPEYPLVAWMEIAEFPDLPDVVDGWQSWSQKITLLDRSTGRRVERTFLPVGNGSLDMNWSPDGGELHVNSPEGIFVLSREGVRTATLERTSETQESARVETSLFEVTYQGETLWENDPDLREISYGRTVELKSEGNMSHWLLLPDPQLCPKPAEGYPVVTWVYPARRHHKKPLNFEPAGIELGELYALTLFCSKGYALYLPSTYPRNAVDGGRGTTLNHEPAAEMIASYQRSLVPLQESGLIDMNRIAVAGHSGGGNLTLEIAASDTPIKTAMAFSGISDRAMWYWTFPPDVTTRSQPENLIWKYIYFSWGESGQGDMGVPPWKDPDRWTRNSPVYRADLITRPVLLICGESERLHAEAMFTALLRQNKRARMLRFLDEPHYIRGRENYRVLWGELFAWLEENL